MYKIIRTDPCNVNEMFERRTFDFIDECYNYRLYIPANYNKAEKYPLLVFLHGAGERGSDNEKQLSVGIWHIFDDPESPAYDAIVLAMQVAEDCRWVDVPWEEGRYSVDELSQSRHMTALVHLISKIKREFSVDEDRVYATGLSMGGFGTWDLMTRHGSIIAAGVVLCGGGDETKAKLLKRIPTRLYHGTDDGVVPVAGSRDMYSAIKLEGGNLIDYTEYEGYGHNVWDAAYSDRDMLRWLFSQTRKDRRLRAEKKKKATVLGAVGAGIIAAAAGAVAILKRKK